MVFYTFLYVFFIWIGQAKLATIQSEGDVKARKVVFFVTGCGAGEAGRGGHRGPRFQ